MIILKQNKLEESDLLKIETIMQKISDDPYAYTLGHSLLDKPRSEVYGFIAGLVKRMNICQTLGITISNFLDFLIDVERRYLNNPYHSFYHAVDMVMVLYHFFECYDMSEYLTRMDIAMMIVAALCHDVGHTGKNNQFEVSCKSKLAEEFNNLSVLESNSCKLALELLDKHDLIRNIETKSRHYGSPLTRHEFKQSIIKMILATDMTHHFDLLHNISVLHNVVSKNALQNKMKPLFSKQEDAFFYFEKNHFHSKETETITVKSVVEEDTETVTVESVVEEEDRDHPHGLSSLGKSSSKLTQEERLMLCNIIIHAADVSSPCRPWELFHKLARLLYVEFSEQAETEKKLGLPQHMNPLQDNLQTTNMRFIDFVYPYFENLSVLFPKSFELLDVCSKNREEWSKLSSEPTDLESKVSIKVSMEDCPAHTPFAESGIHTSESIEKDVEKRSSSPAVSSWQISSTHKRKGEELSSAHIKVMRSNSDSPSRYVDFLI
ncbi:hypothetical protein RMATCC62417_13779 [Rhizopus microsporus]|nr:hypothetical protein RMATCC62417_13779 [Rhizopus microsporus]